MNYVILVQFINFLYGNSAFTFNPFQPHDAIWHHAFHLFLICMLLPVGSSSHLSTLR